MSAKRDGHAGRGREEPDGFTYLESAWRVRLAAGLPGHAGLNREEAGDMSGPSAVLQPAASPSATLRSTGLLSAGPPTPREWRPAAVLVLLFPTERGPATVLTLRSENLQHHPGQVSFPGGALEPGETAETAAMREAKEEIGLEARAKVVGLLSPVYVPPSGYRLQPVLAFTGERPELRAHAAEVASLVEVALDELIAPPSIEFETRLVDGTERSMPFFQAGEHRVWGATGLIISELAVLWGAVRRELPR